jgi:prepilin-type N-terminal cleavage/methylation domain-containing protein
MTPNHFSRFRRGITLIELLVAIGILSILIGLVLGAVSKIRETALRTEKANWYNQRLLGATVDRQLPISVLFIGNSLTQTGPADVPRMLQELTNAAGSKPPLEIEAYAPGGKTLEDHWNDGIALQKIRSQPWDFVVLQEQSQRPVFEPEAMFNSSRRFHREIKEQQSITLFYMTWSRPPQAQTQPNWTKPYVRITKELGIGAECAPVGLAWEKALPLPIGNRIHAPNDYHQSPIGAYFNACVFYATIYDKSPVGLPNRVEFDGQVIVDLSASDAQLLQNLAWQAMNDIKSMTRPAWR